VIVPLLSSFLVVALAEMGDKTQLVALSMASRYRRPWTVLLGIFIATTVNHALASSVGVWTATRIPAAGVQWVLALSFIGFGVWTLVPDSSVELDRLPAWGPLVTTAVVFFLAEMGDKTQLATVALAARFGSPAAVTAGTTLGMRSPYSPGPTSRRDCRWSGYAAPQPRCSSCSVSRSSSSSSAND